VDLPLEDGRNRTILGFSACRDICCRFLPAIPYLSIPLETNICPAWTAAKEIECPSIPAVRLRKQISFGVAGVFGLVALGRWAALSSLFSANFLPHRCCYLPKAGLVRANALADGLIAAPYAVLFGCLFWLAARFRHVAALHHYLWIFVGFGLFIVACGFTHGMEIVTIWWPYHPFATALKVGCAAVSIPTAILFAKSTPGLAGKVQGLLDSVARAQRETEDEAINYRGQIEAINRSQMMIEFAMDGTIIKRSRGA
jgi:hypothetical protein